MDEIRMEVMIGEDGREKVLKKFETWIDDGGGEDTFGIDSVGVGSEVAAVSSSSLWIVYSFKTSVIVLESKSSWTTRDGDLGF